MNLKEIALLVPFTDVDSLRYDLDCIKVTPEYAEATDGRIAVRMPIENGKSCYISRDVFVNPAETLDINYDSNDVTGGVSTECHWPPTDKILQKFRERKHAAETTVKLNPECLQAIAELARKVGEFGSVTIHFGSDPDNDGLYMTIDKVGGGVVEVALMPISTK